MAKATHSEKEDQETMVLRTVYLPAGLDEELKKLAFHGSTSKGELIRRAVRSLVEAQGGEQTAIPESIKGKAARAPK